MRNKLSALLFLAASVSLPGQVSVRNELSGIPQPNGTPATVLYGTAKITSGGLAVAATTSDTSDPTFIVVGGAGSTGNAVLASTGSLAFCLMDSTIASGAGGYFVVNSTTVANECHAQAAVPAPGTWIIGILSSGSTTSGLSAVVSVISFQLESGPGAITQLTGDVTAGPGTGSQAATVVQVGGSSAANVHAAEQAANAATPSNTASTIVKRDASGDFSANSITAALNGNAATATALASAPSQCVGPQFALGISANGTATCATPPQGNVVGPGSSITGYLPQWSNTGGTLLAGGLPVGTVPAANSVVEAGAGSTIAPGFLPTPTPSSLGGVQSYAQQNHQFLNSVALSGGFTSAQPAFTDLSGVLTLGQTPLTTAGDILSIGAGPILARVAGPTVNGTYCLEEVVTASVSVLPSFGPCSSGGGGGTGTVTSFSSGNLAPLFTTVVATSTTTPALSFSLSSAAADSWFGNGTASPGPPAFNTTPLPASLIPAPTATTLGGAESLAAVSHEWINSLSTAGVFSASQPAFTDISGTATTAQLPLSGVTAGTCGGATQFCATTFNAQGQATGYTQGNATPFLSQSPDCAVTVTSTTLTMGALATVTTPCNVRVGTDVYSLTAPATATISVCPAVNTTNYVYVSTTGAWVLGTNTGVTATSTAQFLIAAGTTTWPADVLPIATVLCNTNAWVTSNGVTDQRAFLSQAVTPSPTNGLTNPSTTTIGEALGACPGTCTITTAANSATGTITSGLVKYVYAAGVKNAQETATTDTSGAIGVCIGACGTTGVATIETSGDVALNLTGTVTGGHYVGISAATAGYGADAGATCPGSGQVIGTVANSTTSPPIVHLQSGLCASGGGGVSSLASANTGATFSASTGAVTMTIQRPVTTVSTATYTVVSADAGAADDFTNATGVAVTLPTAGTAPWTTGVTYHATCDAASNNTCVFTPQTGQTLSGSGLSAATSLTLWGAIGAQGNESVTLTVIGTNWFVSDLTGTSPFFRSGNNQTGAFLKLDGGFETNDLSYSNSCSSTLSVQITTGTANGAKLTGNCALSLTELGAGNYSGPALLVIWQDATGGHTLTCGTGWHMPCPNIDPAPNAATVIPIGYTNNDTAGLTNGPDSPLFMTAGAAITAGQLLCTSTTAMQVVPCAISATNTFVGFASESAASAATVIIKKSGIVPNALLDSGTCAVGNWVVAGSTTAGDVKCTASAPPTGAMVGFAESAQSTVGAAVTVLVDTFVGASGSSTTFQANGTNLTSQSVVNLESGTAPYGVSVVFANPSAGNVSAALSGLLTPAGLALPVGITSVPYTLVSNTAGPVAWEAPSASGRAITGTTTTDTISATDSGANIFLEGTAAVTETLPTATTLGIAQFYTTIVNKSTLAATITPTTWTINGAASATVAAATGCTIYVDPASATNWLTDCGGGGGAGGTPGGTPGQPQFNNAGAFGGESNTFVVQGGTGAIHALTLVAGEKIVLTANDTESAAVPISVANVTIECVPGVAIQQVTASTDLFDVTGSNFTIRSCGLSPPATGVAGVLVNTVAATPANYIRLDHVILNANSSTATNGGSGWVNISGGAHHYLDTDCISSADNCIRIDNQTPATHNTIDDVILRGYHQTTADSTYGLYLVSNTAYTINHIDYDVTASAVGGCIQTNGNGLGPAWSSIRGNCTWAGTGSLEGWGLYGCQRCVVGPASFYDAGHSHVNKALLGLYDFNGTVHDITLHLNSGANEPISILDSRDATLSNIVAGGDLDLGTGYSNDGWSTSNPCISVTQSASATAMSNLTFSGITCLMPPSSTASAMVFSMSGTGTVHFDDVRISSTTLVGIGASGVADTAPAISFVNTNTGAGSSFDSPSVDSSTFSHFATGISIGSTVTNANIGHNTFASVTTPVSDSGTGTLAITHTVVGSGALVSGTPSTLTVTLAGNQVFTTGHFQCTASDQTTQANPIKVTLTSGTSVTFTGPNTSTDTVGYVCAGY